MVLDDFKLLLAICCWLFVTCLYKLLFSAITCKNLFPFAPVVCLVIFLGQLLAPKLKKALQSTWHAKCDHFEDSNSKTHSEMLILAPPYHICKQTSMQVCKNDISYVKLLPEKAELCKVMARSHCTMKF